MLVKRTERFLNGPIFFNLMRLNFMAFGDTHRLEEIAYKMVKRWEKRHEQEIDAVFFPGDVDEIVDKRGAEQRPDIKSRIVDYYYGNKKAPYMTFFVAGNNDEWTILRLFPSGGFIDEKEDKKNMYFLGRSGYKDFMGIRIAGLSGIYKKEEYEKPLPVEPSFLPWQCYRKNELENLIMWKPHIIVLHEWVMPDFIEHLKHRPGRIREFPKKKRTPLRDVILEAQPKYVFMGHKHNNYVEGRIGKTKIYGLMQVTKESDLRHRHCYKVVSIENPI